MKKKDVLNQVNNEVYYGIIPVLKNERIYSFWDIFLLTAAWAIATWTYVQGGYIATLVGMKDGLIATAAGTVLTGLLICFIVLIATKYGIDIWIYQRALFGYIGVIFVALAFLASGFGFEAINAKLYSNSITLIVESTGVTVSEFWSPWLATTCIILGGWIALKGPIAVRTATRIMVPCLLVLGVIILSLVFTKFSLSELAAIKPMYPEMYGGAKENFMMVIESSIAFVFSWLAALGVLSRLVKSGKASYWGHMWGFNIVLAFFVCLGIFTSLAMFSLTGVNSSDPTEWLIELGGPILGLISVIFIAIANITTQAVALYSFSISTKIIKPNWSYTKVAIFWSFWCVVLIFWNGIWDYYDLYLAVIGATGGPLTALILTDFYIVRKRKLSMRSLYRLKNHNAYKYTKGFNIPVLVSFLIGSLSYLFVYDPINDVINSKIFMYTTASGFAMITSATSYFLLSLIKPINKYLRNDMYQGEIKGEKEILENPPQSAEN